ncbi:hypothetical protein F7725_022553 [Dissostichus mawsoni]|uniref:Uncharacterized protein n=1 Tax=Dissostichus mawsoni TaxID=36200 RepID=A0A7J5Z2G0_DISMA|nr:hypothetical protein F7725_022553 [Dissostichus mawsoni]
MVLVPGNGLHVSGEPETPLRTSHRDDQAAMSRKDHTALGTSAKAWSEVFVSLSAVTISILARTAAGKLPVTGVETQMPVSPLQGYLEPEVRDNVGLVVARTVAPVKNGCTVARLLNPTEKELKLHPGSHLGVFHHVKDCDLLTPSEVFPSQQGATPLPDVAGFPLMQSPHRALDA